MVKTPKQANSPLQITEKMGFLKSYSFFWDYILEKEKTHIPSQLLDFPFLNWDYIPEQGKVLDIVQLLDITTRVLFLT